MRKVVLVRVEPSSTGRTRRASGPSPALLAFNRFPMALVVSIDGIDNAASRTFYAATADRMEAEVIPFTQHWGKTNHYPPQRVRNAYGESLDRWLNARHALLPDPADRAIFDNHYIQERGLTDGPLIF